MEAVKKDGEVLRHIDKQTEEMCIIAVKQDVWNLGYVNKQTYNVCCAAIDVSTFALSLVDNQTPEICIYAIRKGLSDKSDIKIPWTEEMKLEWMIINI